MLGIHIFYAELQEPSDQTKAEIMTDVQSFPKKAIPEVVNDALPTKAEATQERVIIFNDLPKWKRPERISLIYGDWPDSF